MNIEFAIKEKQIEILEKVIEKKLVIDKEITELFSEEYTRLENWADNDDSITKQFLDQFDSWFITLENQVTSKDTTKPVTVDYLKAMAVVEGMALRVEDCANTLGVKKDFLGKIYTFAHKVIGRCDACKIKDIDKLNKHIDNNYKQLCKSGHASIEDSDSREKKSE